METADLPPLPVFNLSQVFSLRGRILDNALFQFLGAELSGDSLHQAAEEVRSAMSLPPACHNAVLDSVRILAGRVLDLSVAKELCWRLAGNKPLLRAARPAIPWHRQEAPEWAPVQILSSRYHVHKYAQSKTGEAGRIFRFRFLAGSPCPDTVTKFWSNKTIDFLTRHLGFTGPKQGLVKQDGLEMTSLRMAVLLEPVLCQRGPGFKHINCPASMFAFNRAIIKQRRRIGFECPFQYAHECYQCPQGQRACPVATHPEKLEFKMCRTCRAESWFDTDAAWINDLCIDCQSLVDSGITPKPRSQRNG